MQKMKKAPKSLKSKMFNFGLCLTSDDWPSDPSNKRQPKCKKGPLSHEKMKCLFSDYVQILMISKAIQAMKVNHQLRMANFARFATPPIFSH